VKIAALFPGQGSQNVGMVKNLLEEFPFTKQIFEEASDALKQDLVKLCNEGPADTLQMTENAQPAILTTSYAWFQVLKRNLDFSPAAGAGHSLGEYSALLAAGAMNLSEAVRLVRMRGQLMQNAVPKGLGKMSAVLGLSDEKVEELCRLASTAGSSVVPANFNAPSQVVVAGNAEAVDRLAAIAAAPENPELKARKVIPLAVSAPFHCPLMKPVKEKFLPSLQSVAWKTRVFPIVHNLDAEMRSDGDLLTLLSDQIDHPVRWTQCVQRLAKDGTQAYVEMGPGKVLTGLVKRIAEGAKLFNLESSADVKAFETFYKETL